MFCLRPSGALALILLLACAPGARAAERGWPVAAMAAADAEIVELGAERGRAGYRVRTDQMRLLYAVQQSIASVAELDCELVVIEGDLPNAFAGEDARAGPVVGLNFAMLELIGYDAHAAAALLGHEIAHLKLAHGERARSGTATGGIVRVLGGAVLSGFGVAGAGVLSDLAVTAVETHYSREHEREADYLGVIWAVEAGYEADGAVRLHEALQAAGGARPLPFLASHPSEPERVATLKGLARRLARGR